MITQYTFTGTKQAGGPKLPAAKASDTTVSEVIRAALANDDRQRAKTKLRGEVSGGGKKPWRQKGTGRARAGSNRSPLWRGGGVTFGPDGSLRARKRLPAKVRRNALLAVFTAKEQDGALVVVSGKPALTKTKDGAKFFAKLGLEGATLFVVTGGELPQAIGLRNLADLELATSDDVNVADLARYRNTVLSQAAWDVIVGGKAPAAKPAAAPAKAKAAPAKAKPAAAKAPAKPAAKKPTAPAAKKPAAKKAKQS